jgi:uncharacterized membrane protein (GlpM family)
VKSCHEAQLASPGAAIIGTRMLGDLALRFVIGGAVVSAFAAIAEVFEPKSFSGLFGAAPSVAIATLALTYHHDGPTATATAARWMLVATPALFIYGGCCVAACRRDHVPVSVAAIAAWLAWLAVAFGLWFPLHGVIAP